MRAAGVAVAAASLTIAAPGAQTAITITVDVGANRHPINPNIYGVAHATSTQLSDLNSPLNRNGGNNTTRYNWQQNADNRGSDFFSKVSVIRARRKVNAATRSLPTPKPRTRR